MITKKAVKELREIQIKANIGLKDEGISTLALPWPVCEYIRLANLAMTILEDEVENLA